MTPERMDSTELVAFLLGIPGCSVAVSRFRLVQLRCERAACAGRSRPNAGGNCPHKDVRTMAESREAARLRRQGAAGPGALACGVITHEVVYGSLLQECRRALHARIVDALERTSDGDSSADRMVGQPVNLLCHAVRGQLWDKAVA
jgi:hypothetical protein